MGNSPLVNYTKISPNSSNPRNHVIDTITIHCVVGQLSVETIGNIFAPTSRQASSNYGIGSDGRIGMYVEEKNRSWCSSSRSNDNRAITIEVASDTTHPYKVNDKAFAALLDLVTDICKRNEIKELKWKGDKSLIGQVDKQNMTVHRWFANKACPGDYLYNLHGKIAEEVNKRLNQSSDNSGTPIMGKIECTAEQLEAFLLSKNPSPKLNINVTDFCNLWVTEAEIEGVRGDIAFCQACHETGYFKYGGIVQPSQNNYGGIGALNRNSAGQAATFETPQIGVRASIQHLKAYGSKAALVNEVVDPRFKLVTRGIAPNFEDLGGRWAYPGYDKSKYTSLEAAKAAKDTYGHFILKKYEALKQVKVEVPDPVDPNADKIDQVKKLLSEAIGILQSIN